MHWGCAPFHRVVNLWLLGFQDGGNYPARPGSSAIHIHPQVSVTLGCGVSRRAPPPPPLCFARFGDLDVRLLLPPFPVFVELVCGWVLIVCHLDVCVVHGAMQTEEGEDSARQSSPHPKKDPLSQPRAADNCFSAANHTLTSDSLVQGVPHYNPPDLLCSGLPAGSKRHAKSEKSWKRGNERRWVYDAMPQIGFLTS
jgi:hypothetical protein